MKKTKIIYWTVTGLFGAFMIFSAIPDIIKSPEAMEFMRGLGYPDYFTPFIGIAKVLGIIAILIPGFSRIKEWAYAGLFFDLFGAVYSIMMTQEIQPQLAIMLLPFIFLFWSYHLHHKIQSEKVLGHKNF